MPYPLAIRPENDPTLRRRPSRYPRDEAAHTPPAEAYGNDPQGVGNAAYEYPDHIGTEGHGVGTEHYRQHSPFGTEAQGFGNDPYSETTPTYRVDYPGDASTCSGAPPPWVDNLTQRMDRLQMGQFRIYDRMTQFQEYYEQQRRMDEHRWRTNDSRWDTSDERWQSTAEFMHEMERHFPPYDRQ